MSYLNLSVANKAHRANQIISDLGGAGYLLIYSGAVPASPDTTVSAGALLAALPLSATPGTLFYQVQNAAVVAGGSGGTNGTQTVTGTTGTGTKFQASVTVAGGAVTAVNSIATAGNYSALPSNLNSEPVTGAGLTGATLSLAMAGGVNFNAITSANASATGTAAWGRFAVNSTAGGAGIVDGDVGTSGATIIINTTAITSGLQISCTSAQLTEA